MTEHLQLAKTIITQLHERGLFIVTVESCTGGGLANCLTNIPGSSDCIKDSFITYSNEAKIALGVSKDWLDAHGPYNQETSIEMAEVGIRKSIKADIGVGITGQIVEGGISIVYVAVKFAEKLIANKLELEAGERPAVKEKIINNALLIILEVLQ